MRAFNDIFQSELEQILVLSTAHVDEATADVINYGDKQERYQIGDPMAYEYGWVFRPAHVGVIHEELDKVPECILKACEYAENMNCTFLVYDESGKEVTWLPRYEW